jgi:glyoxylase-like metal-dependent hydrolase (beta-lactamase superfamily II)
MKAVKELQAFETSEGAHIYQIPLEAFPGFWSHAYLVISDELLVLIDTGSGFGDSNHQLTNGIQEAGMIESGRSLTIEDLSHVLITHGHIDHFGGLTDIVSKSKALVGVHELDRRNLTNYEERRVFVSRRLEEYLIEAGVDEEKRENLLGLYRITKELFRSVQVDFTYEAIGMHLGPFDFMHVPGHCAGHVVIRLHDFLFCGDHILTDITPHQAPEQLTSWTGLDHYLHSLDTMENWANGVNLALCGHKEVVMDLTGRIAEIRAMHMDRLERVMEFFSSPNTILELSKTLFGEVNGYNSLLAIEEAGAHVEYLYQRGRLGIENFDELGMSIEPIPLYYKCL